MISHLTPALLLRDEQAPPAGLAEGGPASSPPSSPGVGGVGGRGKAQWQGEAQAQQGDPFGRASANWLPARDARRDVGGRRAVFHARPQWRWEVTRATAGGPTSRRW